MAASVADALLFELPWEQYQRLEDPPGLRFEFDEGRLIASPTGVNAHDFLVKILAGLLERYEEETDDRHCFSLAEHSFFMPPGGRDLRPDVGIVVDQRKDRPVEANAWTEGAPDIAVEVLSDSTEKRDRGFKAQRYFEGGTREYWLLDPRRETAEFLRRGPEGWVPAPLDGDTYRTELLPGFALDLPHLWRRLLRKLRRGT